MRGGEDCEIVDGGEERIGDPFVGEYGKKTGCQELPDLERVVLVVLKDAGMISELIQAFGGELLSMNGEDDEPVAGNIDTSGWGDSDSGIAA